MTTNYFLPDLEDPAAVAAFLDEGYSNPEDRVAVAKLFGEIHADNAAKQRRVAVQKHQQALEKHERALEWYSDPNGGYKEIRRLVDGGLTLEEAQDRVYLQAAGGLGGAE